MVLPIMTKFARQKGINLLTTGDWTHPLWLREIKQELKETSEGIFSLKTGKSDDPRFILSVEVSSIYSQGGKVRRIHCLLFAPNIETAEKFNQEMIKKGANLSSDGRPIVGLKPPQLLELIMGINDKSFLIPCHVWTPWFSLYGSMSGFDSIEECFGEYSKYIYGVETGLSSDPAMNWRIKDLDSRSILSFSDSHSPMKMGRESTVFELEELTFENIKAAIMRKSPKNKVAYTVEFYPEEGKYHYTGHRNCKIVYSPEDTKKKGKVCPVCKKNLTVGVMERVEGLASSPEKITTKLGSSGISWALDPSKSHPPFAKLVPLNEIIAETLNTSTASLKVKDMYELMTSSLASEFDILMKIATHEISKIAGEGIAQAISRVRRGEIYIAPGYDGEFGVVKIKREGKDVAKTDSPMQAALDI